MWSVIVQFVSQFDSAILFHHFLLAL
jgi:hypothetical protein